MVFWKLEYSYFDDVEDLYDELLKQEELYFENPEQAMAFITHLMRDHTVIAFNVKRCCTAIYNIETTLNRKVDK